jgi:hypothetical protein
MSFYGKTTFRPAPTRMLLRDQVDSNLKPCLHEPQDELVTIAITTFNQADE